MHSHAGPSVPLSAPYSKPDRSVIIALLLLQAVLIGLCEVFSFYVPLAFLALLFIWLPWHNLFLSLNGLVLLHVLIIESTESITAPEIIIGLTMFYIIGVWIFSRTMLEHGQITESGGDLALLCFVGLCVLSIVPGFLHGVSPLKWLRELIPFISYLILFPLRSVLKGKREIRILVTTLFVLCLLVVFRNVFRYRSSMAAVEMMWQIASSRTAINESFFFASIILAASIMLFSTSWMVRILMIWLIGMFALALIITFSRGYWVATALGLFILFWLVPARIKGRILIFSSILIGCSGLIITFFFGEFGELILESVFGRFVTLGSFLEDPSFRSRITESAKVLTLIGNHPIWGYGLGAEYDFVSMIPRVMPTFYVHNAYLYLLFKTGIPGLAAFLIFYFAGLREGFRRSRGEDDPFLKAVRLGFLSMLLAMIPLSITSPQFIQKDSVLLISLGFAVLTGGPRAQCPDERMKGSG